jgi:hypothetical protein
VNELDQYTEDQLSRIKEAWVAAIEAGKKAKEDFHKSGLEVMKFYGRAHELDTLDGKRPDGWWRQATINKTFEGVKIFGSYLHQQSPTRRVQGSGDDQLAGILEKLLKYSARELDLRRHGRKGVVDGLTKGRGVLWTEIDEHTQLVHSRHESVDNILVDPDGTGPDDYWWIARMRREPIWKFKRKYGDAAKDVKPDQDVTGTANEEEQNKKLAGKSQDLVTYWEIYSKMGDGLRAKKAEEGVAGPADDGADEQNRWKDYRLIILAPTEDAPVHIGEWPTPYWADVRSMGWPCAFWDSAANPGQPWPISIFKVGLPIQKWIDWAYSFLLRKVRTTCRDIVVVPERLTEKQRAVVRNDAMRDLEIMYADDTQIDDIRKVFTVLQFSQMNGDLLKAIEMAEQKFREVTGLHEILMGISDASFRSAEEARVKDRNSRSRVDDMSQEIEVWHTEAARHEAIALRFHFGHRPELIAELLGPEAAEAWGMFQAGDLKSIMREYGYSIEAGSMRRVTPEVRVDQSQMAMETLLPILMETGSLEQANNLINEWCEARQIPNPERFHIATTVVEGSLVTPAQMQQQAAAQQEQIQAEAQEVFKQAEAEAQGNVVTQGQIAMNQAQNQTEIIKEQMRNASAEKQTAVKAVAALMKPAAGGGK